jgi:hypothetical protein
MTVSNAAQTQTGSARPVLLGGAVQPNRLPLWLGLYAAALLVPFASEVGRAGAQAGILSGPWLLLRAAAALLVFRLAARPGSAAALAAGLGAGHLVAVTMVDPLLGGAAFTSSALGQLIRIAPALFAFLAAKEHLWLMANRNAVVASPEFVVRTAVSAFIVLCLATGPLVVTFLALAIITLGGPVPPLHP